MVKSLRIWVTEIKTDFQTRCREKKAFQLRGAFSLCLATGRARIPRGPAFPALNGATLGRRRRRNGSGHLVFFRHFSLRGRYFVCEFSARRRKKNVFFIGKNVLGPGPSEKSNKSWGNFVERVSSRGKSGFFARPGGGGSKNRNGNFISAKIRIFLLNHARNYLFFGEI